MDRAEELVREMEEEGIDAPIDIYHIMMDGYTSIGNEDKCLIVFDRLKASIIQYNCIGEWNLLMLGQMFFCTTYNIE